MFYSVDSSVDALQASSDQSELENANPPALIGGGQPGQGVNELISWNEELLRGVNGSFRAVLGG